MNKDLPDYCAVIRTLGTAGEKYQHLLESLASQTHPPRRIIVYLAEGYEKPKETIGTEQIVYVKKGMVAQRALPYNEVDTEWMLFLDDDVAIEPWGVEKMMTDTLRAFADVCAFDAFPHNDIPTRSRVAMALMLTSIPRLFKRNKGYTVNLLGTDCYNPRPCVDYAWSTTNAGPAFMARKKDFLRIRYNEELWLDKTPVAFPEDKVMFYKMHLNGLNIITHYNCGFTHLDARTSTVSSNQEEKLRKCEYSAAHNFLIFDELYVKPNLSWWQRPLRALLRGYMNMAVGVYRLVNRFKGTDFADERRRGRRDARRYLASLK